ncbi:MAG: ECF transporter S component [Clostridia bacterium]|nr:ECF transporter S component [Clostridia bacterium]
MTTKRKSTINPLVVEMTMTAFLAALILLMTFTPIGYIPIGPVKMTLLTLPVAVGSVVLGMRSGLILGGVFGLTSFYTCFGMDAVGNVLLGINPFFTFIMCVVPRLLCGFLPALIYKGISANGTKRTWFAIPVATASVAVINTVLFLGSMWLFFGNSLSDVVGVAIDNILALFALFAGTNGLIEIAVNIVIGTAICKPLTLLKKRLV